MIKELIISITAYTVALFIVKIIEKIFIKIVGQNRKIK